MTPEAQRDLEDAFHYIESVLSASYLRRTNRAQTKVKLAVIKDAIRRVDVAEQQRLLAAADMTAQERDEAQMVLLTRWLNALGITDADR